MKKKPEPKRCVWFGPLNTKAEAEAARHYYCEDDEHYRYVSEPVMRWAVIRIAKPKKKKKKAQTLRARKSSAKSRR